MASFSAADEYRHENVPFDPKEDAICQGDPVNVIDELVSSIPDLKLYTRSSPRYEALRGVYNTLITARPLVICRPRSIEQIQSIVRIVAKYPDVPLGVRCGGHDVYGRGCIADSVSIDMRELDTQVLAEDKETVKIGGGVTSDNFVAFLNTHGLCTAQGTAGHVGWTGWAVWGGYGPFNDYVGLGVDNILAAKMINGKGELIEADEELLWGIRGAGGNFGIIVETQVKVYSMPKIIAGFVGYAWDEAEQVLLGLQDMLDQGTPDAFCVQMGFMKSKWGLGMTLIYIWPDADMEEGQKWLEKVRGLGKVVVDTVSETTFNDFQKITSKPVTKPANVYTRHASIPRFTPASVKQLLQQIERIPDTRQYNAIAHIAHGKCVRPNPNASFATRQPHILFHINSCDETERMSDGEGWVNGLVDALKSTGEAMKPVYVSFMGDEEDVTQSFGKGWDRLKALKKKVDEDNVFCFSQPKLGSA